MEGYREYEPTTWDAKKKPLALFNGMTVGRDKILSYFNDYYYSCLAIYNRFKRFGLPFGGGWAEQPEYVVEIIETIDECVESWSSHKRKQTEAKYGKGK
jgi:hypothetical protein